MLIIPPAKYRGPRRQKVTVPAVPPPVVALTLVAASYQDDALVIIMQFNKAIDISGFNGGSVEVDDGSINQASYVGGENAVLVDAQTVQCDLVRIASDTEPGVFLSVVAGNGIVAVDGSGEWSGVGELMLPFG